MTTGLEKITTILITGPPGVGKTTLVRNICKELQSNYHGFFTEEVRGPIGRIGFDAVTLQGQRAILARESLQDKINRPTVGKYSIYLSEFENLVLPLLSVVNDDGVLVIDEIGKMELKSHKFEVAMQSLLERTTPILATIPLQTRNPIAIVERLKSSPNSKIFHLTKSNRNQMLKEVLSNVRLLCTK